MRYRLRGLLRELGRDPNDVSFALVTDGEILATHNQRVRGMFRDHLRARGVTLIENSAVREVQRGTVVCVDGSELGFDELIWVTQAGAAAWLASSGLAVDAGGFIRINAALQSISDPRVFAAGDVASSVQHPRPKAGVFAVRQGPPLTDNLRRAVAGQEPVPFVPQTKFLSLISTGDRYAVASRGELAAQGALLWHLKDGSIAAGCASIRAFPVSDPAPRAAETLPEATRTFTMREIFAPNLIPASRAPSYWAHPAPLQGLSHSRGVSRRGRAAGRPGVTHLAEPGLRIQPGLKCPGACDLKCMPRPKILRGAVRSRSY